MHRHDEQTNSCQMMLKEGDSVDQTSIRASTHLRSYHFRVGLKRGCWNLSGPNLRPETNPRRLTASYPASHILSSYLRTTVLFPRQTTTRTLPALRTLGGHLVTAVRLSSRTLWPAPTHLWIPRHRVEHPPYDGYSMTHHHCPYRLGRTESHRTDARTGSLQNGTVFHL